MRIFFAGCESERYDKILYEQGVQHRLQNYIYLKKGPTKIFKHLLIDSGGFAARTRGIQIKIEDYARWLNEHEIELAFEVDTNSIDETTYNRHFLLKETRAKIIPIYHFSDYFHRRFDMLKEFLDAHDYIAIGGIAGMAVGEQSRRFFDWVFSNVKQTAKIHGLGITSPKLLNLYPFFSVDSSSWASSARYGSIKSERDKRVVKFRNKTQHYTETIRYDIAATIELEKKVTNVWKLRGITW